MSIFVCLIVLGLNFVDIYCDMNYVFNVVLFYFFILLTYFVPVCIHVAYILIFTLNLL